MKLGEIGIVAFSFGVPYTILSNRRIATIASQKAEEFKARIYTQLDILVKKGLTVDYTEEEPGKPPPTLRIARGAVKWAQKHNLKELWIVAAKPHLWRCQRDLEQAIKEVKAQIKVRLCQKEIEQFPEKEWFCENSTQKRTRFQNRYYRERILKCLPFFLYKHIAN